MGQNNKEKYSDFANVERMRNELIPEEFPEGTYGSSINKEERVYSKSTPWKEGQKRMSAFVYPYEEFHAHTPRQTPGSHPIHSDTAMDESTEEEQ